MIAETLDRNGSGLASALYLGTVSHHRRKPVEHAFSYPVFLAMLDLAELPEALDRHPLWSARRPAPIRFRARDFLAEKATGPVDGPRELAERARELVRTRTGQAPPAGPVRVLASPRFLGVGFNPVSFLFLYDEEGQRVEAVIAEVTNTPWGGRHAYLARPGPGGGPIRTRVRKRLHVSPFNPMEQAYELRIGEPGERLGITITNEQGGEVIFGAGLSLRRHPLGRREMSRVLAAYPAATIVTLARIYWQGLRLRLKGAPHYPHPGTGGAAITLPADEDPGHKPPARRRPRRLRGGDPRAGRRARRMAPGRERASARRTPG